MSNAGPHAHDVRLSKTRTYPAVFQALAKLPNETVIDGEIVAVGGDGRPAFQLLQNTTVGAVASTFAYQGTRGRVRRSRARRRPA